MLRVLDVSRKKIFFLKTIIMNVCIDVLQPSVTIRSCKRGEFDYNVASDRLSFEACHLVVSMKGYQSGLHQEQHRSIKG